MPIKDYFKFFTSGFGGDEIDYIVTFKVDKPEIDKYPKLLKIGNWSEYGDRGYRLLCSLSKENFINIISSETGIDKSNIEVMSPTDNIWIR